jgi:serine/threonine protein kinase
VGPVRTLREALQEGIDAAAWTTALRSAAAELDALHAAGAVHGDLTPDTVLVAPDGTARLAAARHDGRASAEDDTIVAAREDVLAATAPEVLRGHAPGPAADRYALAVVLFGCAVGEPPFRTLEAAIDHALGAREPRASALRPSLPCEVDGVLAAALAREPARRPATAVALVDAFRDALGASAVRRRRFAAPRRLLRTGR